MADKNNSVSTQASGNHADTSVVEAIATLKHFCKEMGVELEFIKVSGKTGFKSIYGVEFRTVIYEDDATHWRHNQGNGLVTDSSKRIVMYSNPPEEQL